MEERANIDQLIIAASYKEKEEKYWLNKLEGELVKTTLPAEPYVDRIPENSGPAEFGFQLEEELFSRLIRLSAGVDVKLYLALVSGIVALLNRYTGSDDIIIGAPIFIPETEENLINTILVIRNRFSGRYSFKELLFRVRQSVIEADEHRNYPVEVLMDKLGIHSAEKDFPLFDISVVLENIQQEKFILRVSHGMAFFFLRSSHGITGKLRYNPLRYREATARRVLSHFSRLLKGGLATPERPLADIDILSVSEKKRLLQDFNDTDTGYPEKMTIHRLFEAQAAVRQHGLAVSCDNENLTYNGLNFEANRLARFLRTTGVKPDVVVPVMLERTTWMIVGLLGILKSGGAYLPIDSDYPEERIKYMLEDCNANLFIAGRQASGTAGFRGKVVDLGDEKIWRGATGNLPHVNVPSNLAYIIYTSGTTGRPKGVMIGHKNVVRLMFNDNFLFDFDSSDTWTLFHSYNFDFSVWEMYGALLYGGKLVVIPRLVARDPERYLEILRREQVSVLNQTPSYFYNLASEESRRSTADLKIKYIIFGGEALKPAKLKKWYERYPGIKLINMFGITETTVHVTYKEITAGEIEGNISCIGQPIPTLSTYVLDNNLRLLPVGIYGELCVGGEGVGRGYLNRGELTGDRFLTNPYKPGQGLYRSGDLVRWFDNGDMEYSGRIDHQVKIRGFRIELGEIENQLLGHFPLKESLVVMTEDDTGDRELTAYCSPDKARVFPLWQLLNFKRRGLQGDKSQYELPNGMPIFYLNRHETDFMYDEIFTGNIYLKHGINLGKDACVFDVGANIGVFSIFVGQLCEDADIFAFEPVPAVYEFLALNASVYCRKARLFQFGISSEPGETSFTYYPHASVLSGAFADGDEEKKTVQAFIRNQEIQGTGEIGFSENQLDELLENRLSHTRVRCDMKTLSQVIRENDVERIDLLKIDVEKGEVDVLQGIMEEDWPKIKQVVLEVHDVEGRLKRIVELLESKGYDVLVEQADSLHDTDIYMLYALPPSASGLSRAADGSTNRNSVSPASFYSEEILKGEMRRFLKETLPDYMIPSSFVLIDTFPLTANGKIDRKALPLPELKTGRYSKPRNSREKRLTAVWADVLKTDSRVIGIDANFFETGGHSLKAINLVSRIHKEFNVKIPLAELFKNPTIMGLAEYLERTVKEKYESVKSGEWKDYYTLSPAQKRLYILYRLDPEGTGYNMPRLTRLPDGASRHRLEQAFRQLILRHESLRTSFQTVANEPVQRIHAAVEFTISYYEAEGRSYAEIMEKFIRPFDLSSPPLMRVGLIRTVESGDVLMVDMHHIICDGVSVDLLEKDFIYFYLNRALPDLRIQYRDFAEWLQRREIEGELSAQEIFWSEAFSGEIPVLNITTDYPRPAIQSFEGGKLNFDLKSDQIDAIRELAMAEDVTLFMLLLAIFYVLLHKVSGQEDIVVGTPVAGRRHSDLEPVIGMFVNTLALRNHPAGDRRFGEFLSELRERTWAAFDNQEYPFEDLVETVAIKRDAGRNPVFDVMFVWQNLENEAEKIVESGALAPIEAIDYDNQVSKFDLTLLAAEVKDDLWLTFEYCTKLFDRHTVERFADCFRQITASVLNSPRGKISNMEIVSPEEKRRIVYEFNATVTDYPREETLWRLFADRAAFHPHRTGLVFEERQSTYGDLHARSGRLAGVLKSRGVGPDEAVGLMVEKSPEMIVGLLSILKAGGTYLALDFGFPASRLEYILRECGCRWLLTRRSFIDSGGILSSVDFGGEYCFVDDDPVGEDRSIHSLPAGSSGDLAYLIYTSGSTGTPKGVMVEQRSVVRLVKSTHYLEFKEGDRLLQTGVLAFDASTFEIWGSLLNGLTLCLVSRETLLDPAIFKESVQRLAVQTMWLTSALFNRLVDADIGIFSGLANLLVGGDVLSPVHIGRLRRRFPGLKVVNGYGPTENTTFSTTFLITGEYGDNIPIGKPIANSTAYIFDAGDRLVPLRVGGELCVGGDGVARGYLNEPELTGEKFIMNPLAAGEKLYRTGDLARWRADGNLEFLGRRDQQVKIRGYRVELGEIEHGLLCHEAIKAAVVTLRETGGGDGSICAYIVSHRDIDPVELREYLSGRLPGYMIPAQLVRLDKIPLTVNGKVDRRALPAPDLSTPGVRAAPENETETRLTEIWSELLGLAGDRLSVEADFFQLGGHSLKATVLVSRIHREMGVKIPLVEIFRSPSIRGVAAYIRGASAERYHSIESVEKRDYYVVSSAQKRLYILHQMESADVSYNMPRLIALGAEVDEDRLERVFNQLIDRHESLRSSFLTVGDEPYQRVHRRVAFEIEHVELSSEVLAAGEGRSLVRAFDLSRAPLLRVVLIKEGGGGDRLLVDMHHIISDGVSQGILEREFLSLYRGDGLPPLRLQYRDYAVWQTAERQRRSTAAQASYWQGVFSSGIPVLGLAVDSPRPLIQSFAGCSVSFQMRGTETGILQSLMQQCQATLFMTLLSVLTLLLSKLSGQEDIVVGTPVAGRRHADLEGIIGMFVNMLALRNFPLSVKGFPDYLAEVKERTLQAFENQEYPFEELVDRLSVRRDAGRNPLFDVVFNLLSVDDFRMVGGMSGHGEHVECSAKFDLTFTAVDMGDELLFNIEYSRQLFEAATIEVMMGYFRRLLLQLGEAPGRRLGDVEIISEAERRRIVYEFNATVTDNPPGKTIPRMFRAQAGRTPGGTAAVDGEYQMTYGELDRLIVNLAGSLRERRVVWNTVVGLMVDQSLAMILGMMGILAAGGAYLPLNPRYPVLRKRYMLADGGAELLLTGGWPAEDIGDSVEVIDLGDKNLYTGGEDQPETCTGLGDLAYVIYTSGSTGQPKGVPITHGNFYTLLVWGREVLGLSSEDRVVQNLSYYFDWSVFEIFSALCWGSSLYLISEAVRLSPGDYIDFIGKKGISVLHITPSHFQALAALERRLESLRILCLGAEKLTLNLVERSFGLVSDECRLFNCYGPTEATIIASVQEIDRGSVEGYTRLSSVPVGMPVAGARLWVLDKNKRLCPVHVEGELYISGGGLAPGYLNDVEKTSGQFMRNIVREIGVDYLYRTGDRVRWLGDGSVEFLGRIDHQVKIRGHRVELGEIENRLLKQSMVEEAVVTEIPAPHGEHLLCAYIVPRDEFAPSKLREELSRSLPDYMLPSYFVRLARIPLNPNGKLDRSALPVPKMERSEEYVAPGNEIEKKLVGIWAGLLGLEENHIGINDDFFQLGGHSLKATVLVSRIHREMGVKIPLVEIFRSPFIKHLAHYLKAAGNHLDGVEEDENLILLRGSHTEAKHFFMVHDGNGLVEGYIEFLNRLSPRFNYWGLKADPLENFSPRNTTIEDVASEYIRKMRRVQSQPPFYLGGWSIGGSIAFEMARQLEELREEVAFLAIIDSIAPDRMLGKGETPFTIETELNWVPEDLRTAEWREILEKSAEVETFWPEVVEYLEKNNFNVEEIRGYIPRSYADSLPIIESRDIKGLVKYLNINRTFDHARRIYIPRGTCNAPVRFFWAGRSEIFNRDEWNRYCRKPAGHYEITGDHYSIFKIPDVDDFARAFDEILTDL